MSGTLTITPDLSSGGTARQLLKREETGGRVLACAEDFTWGPLVPTATPEALIRLRYRHWCKIYSADWPRRKPQPPLRATLQAAERIDVLLCGTGREQLFLLALADLLGDADVDPGKLRLYQYAAEKTWYALGMLNLEKLGNRPAPTPLTGATIAALRDIWSVIREPKPHNLFALKEKGSKTPGFPHLHRAVEDLISSYPDTRTGLTLAEHRLLEAMPTDWTKSVNVVGTAMTGKGEGRSVGDLILFNCLVGLTDTPSPAIELRGNPSRARHCEVRITEFGRACLAGEASHALTNGIDTWAGGVHLTPDNLWFRDGDRLAAPV